MKTTTIVLGLFLTAISAWAGDLNPSAPPTAGTMKSLSDIEPRTAVQSLPGSASALFVISQPGSYYLTAGITVTELKHGISIEASNVTLDLCGFTLTGAVDMASSDELAYDGIRIWTGCKNITIRNGVIQGERRTRRVGIPPHFIFLYSKPFSRGIAAEWDLTVIPRSMCSAVQVRDVIVRGCRGYGIILKGKGHFVSGCTVENNEGPGIHAGYPSTVKENHSSDNGDNMLPVSSGQFNFQNSFHEDGTYLRDFRIARYETTQQEYCDFLNEFDPAGQYWFKFMRIQQSGSVDQYNYAVTAENGLYPIVYVSWDGAAAFAAWKSAVTGQLYRLPTEQEWEKAAGWDPVEKKLFIYGFHRDAIDNTWCNYNAPFGQIAPVGSFNGTGGKNDAKSYYGCYDMSGNVEEWTSSTEQIPGNSRLFRVVRGGFWGDGETACRVIARKTYNLSPFYNNLGFRLVRDP